MANAVDREKLYRMICALGEADLQKAVSYVSFLRFASVSQGKVLDNLLEEVSRSDVTAPEVLESMAWENRETAPFAEKPHEAFYPEIEPAPYTGDEFFAPVRSPRLDPDVQPFASPDGKGEKPDEKPEGQFFHDFEQDAETPQKTPGQGIQVRKASRSPSLQDDNFFMPVRSERFDELRKSTESEAMKGAKPTKPTKPAKDTKDAKEYSPPPPDMSTPDMIPLDIPPSDSPPAEKTAAPEPGNFDDGTRFEFVEDEGPNHGDDLARLRRVLCLSCADLALLFDVSPNSLYSWFRDAVMDAERSELLRYCLEVATRVEEIAMDRPDLVFRHPFPDGEFFVQKLKRQKVTGQDLKILKDVAQKSEELRRRPKGAIKPFRTFQDAVTLYSTLLYCEV